MAFVVAAVGATGVFAVLAAITVRFYLRVQAALPVLYPTPTNGTGETPEGPSPPV